MRRADVLERLNLHREELRTRFGVASIALFGSYARDEARPDSDVDLLVEFESPPTFLGYMDLIDHLEQLFGTRVDLATPNKLKPRAALRGEGADPCRVTGASTTIVEYARR